MKLVIDQIDKAILAHEQWKVVLRNAVDKRQSIMKPEFATSDTNCDFGKWLLKFPEQIRQKQQFQTVEKLHTDFHHEAGKILALVAAGKSAEAAKELEISSQYSILSAALVIEMELWKNDLVRKKS